MGNVGLIKLQGAWSMNFASRRSSLLPLGASVLAMAAAFSAQYGLGWVPCELCLLQRIPILLAGMAAMGSFYPCQTQVVRRFLVILAALLFLGTSVLAAYHVGVEQHWWLYNGGCSRDPNEIQGAVDFAAALSHPVVVRCDEPPWKWHGITMAGLNVVYSAMVGIVTLLLLLLKCEWSGKDGR